MAKKKVKRKRTGKVKGASPVAYVRASSRKINLALRNLILFVIISFISFILYKVSSNEVLLNFFNLLYIVAGFIALAFLIVLLILVLLRAMGK